VELDFTEQERAFYLAVYKRAKAKFQDLFMRGNVLRNYASVLAILLRLRQICDHPRLLTEDPEALVEKEEVTVDPMAECPFCLEPLVRPLFSSSSCVPRSLDLFFVFFVVFFWFLGRLGGGHALSALVLL